MSQGENTAACAGTAWYQSGSERYPGQAVTNDYPGMTATTPWDGVQGTTSTNPVVNPGCREARMNSVRQFIGDLGNSDATVPQFWPGQFTVHQKCFAGEPNGKDGCAYYVASNVGAEIFFDLGDSNTNTAYAMQQTDVVWAVQKVYQNLSALGIPSLGGGVHNILGAAFYNSTTVGSNTTPEYNTSSGKACAPEGHYNHRTVQQALWNYTIIANVYNYGRTCTGDPDVAATGGRTATVSSSVASSAFSVSGNAHSTSFIATGDGSTDFGWLDPYAFPWNIIPTMKSTDTNCTVGAGTESEWSCVQAFWRRGGSGTVTLQY